MKKTPLNFNWQFIKEHNPSHITQEVQGDMVNIPHMIQDIPMHYFDDQMYQMVSTYQKIFDYDLASSNRLFLDAEGIMHQSTVYLNGKQLKHHVGGYTAFKTELTEALVHGQNNLTIVVDSQENKDHPPFGNVVDYLTYGGIVREITLIETGPVALNHMLVDGTKNTMNVRIDLDDLTAQEKDVRLELMDNDKVLNTWTQKTTSNTITFKESIDVQLWTIDSPKLYTVSLYINHVLLETIRTGFRTIKVDKDHFYLNDEPVFLRGLNRHQCYPYVGYAMPKSAQELDADILKNQLGVIMVRSSHYPPSKHFLNRCDELGLLVFTELPGWQHIGDDHWKKHAFYMLEALIKHDYNHPSIVMIGTRINESKDDNAFYTATQNLTKSIDTTRPTGGVRFIAKSELLEDVYTVNDFVHRGDNRGVSLKHTMTDKNHPYLITEFNGHMFPTKSFDDESKRISHTKRHFRVLNDAYQQQGIMGALGWCMHDYNTHKDFGSNDRICYHGVLDMNRNDKYAASVYASQQEAPYLAVLSMMHIGEMPGGELKEVIVATNCDYLKLYKNDVLIATYHEKSTEYPALPYPPFIITDFIGNQIETNEPFSKKDAKRVKHILLKMLANGLKMSVIMKLQLGYLMIKYKLNYEDAVRLYTTYVGGWGETKKTYKFEGYINDRCVKTVYKGHDDHYSISLKADRDLLEIDTTYEVMRLTVSLNNQLQERAFYSNAVFTIKTTGNLTVIGPKERSMQGGIQSFWVRANTIGEGTVQVSTNDYGSQSITLETVQI